MKEVISNMFHKTNMLRRVVLVMVAVMFMGLGVSLLIKVDFGTDPCTSMNLGMSTLFGLSFGNWQFLFNAILFIVVWITDKKQIGIGTLTNMIGVGYWADFYLWVWDRTLPEFLFVDMVPRLIITFVVLAVFIVAVGVYMAVDLGTAPFDAIAIIISNKQKKVSFQVVRIIYDLTAVLIGFLLGSTIGFVTVIMAFTIGPVAQLVKNKMVRFL